ncbi:Speckle-type POZ protein-like A [Colletotrichum siamense]|uniref:Speckle-type POZ protein-like A n=1 Tax=Colletotrichum siamense TaxID=690259 RepID=UPI001872EBC1|nr:Speckle-type POZ protein-like A [Colletotrichum siamense]KAF5489620.1 Speckle-type POZ protein-like A [Colletotrichum siamense]
MASAAPQAEIPLPTKDAKAKQDPVDEDKYEREPCEAVDDLRTTCIFTALSGLFLSEKYADMTITCNGSTFKAHRAIVCPQSSFFDKAFSASFKEAASGTIDLPDDEPSIFRRLLQFLYTGNYDDGVTPTLGKPAAISLLQPDEVAGELNAPIGVEDPRRGRKVPRRTSTTSRHHSHSAENLDGSGDDMTSVTDDESFSGSSGFDPGYIRRQPSGLEPEEEYNEFSGENVADELADDADDTINKKLSQFEGAGGDVVTLVKKELYGARDDLFLHLRLYVMADKYDVPALKLLARERFYRSAELSWEVADEFPAVVDELYSDTIETHSAMRDIVCRLVGNQVGNVRTRERMEWVMKKHGEFAVGVMNYYILSKDGEFAWS